MRRHSLRDIAWAIADEYGITIEEAFQRLDESLTYIEEETRPAP